MDLFILGMDLCAPAKSNFWGCTIGFSYPRLTRFDLTPNSD